MMGYKGFDKNFRCRDFQFEVGKTYKHDGDIELCEQGFHFCDTPFAVFEYYPPSINRYAIVEAVGNIKSDNNKGHKYCTDEITIIRELSLDELINEQVTEDKFNKSDNFAVINTDKYSAANTTGDYSASTSIGNKSVAISTGYKSASTNTGYISATINTGYQSVATNTGDYSASTSTGNKSVATTTGDYSISNNTGYNSAAISTGYKSASTNTGKYSNAGNTGICSTATTTGNYSAAINVGDYATAIVSGKNSVAIVTGCNSKAKGALGCWLVLAEWKEHSIADLQAFKVDGVRIKPDTFYTLKNGEPIEVTEENS